MRIAALSQTLQARSSGGGRLLCFYLADPTDVGFLDAFFPTAGSREASILWRLDGELIRRRFFDVLTLSLIADGGSGLQLFGALRSDIPTQVPSC
jgi:hypothetical protein